MVSIEQVLDHSEKRKVLTCLSTIELTLSSYKEISNITSKYHYVCTIQQF